MLAVLALLVLLPLNPPAVHENDRWRFGVDAAEAKRRWEVASAHVAWMRSNAPWCEGWIAEAEYLCSCWDKLDNAFRPLGDVRWQMQRLRCLIGPDDYALGRMPDYLPVWRFWVRE